jgi:hypothetical protein
MPGEADARPHPVGVGVTREPRAGTRHPRAPVRAPVRAPGARPAAAPHPAALTARHHSTACRRFSPASRGAVPLGYNSGRRLVYCTPHPSDVRKREILRIGGATQTRRGAVWACLASLGWAVILASHGRGHRIRPSAPGPGDWLFPSSGFNGCRSLRGVVATLSTESASDPASHQLSTPDGPRRAAATEAQRHLGDSPLAAEIQSPASNPTPDSPGPAPRSDLRSATTSRPQRPTPGLASESADLANAAYRSTAFWE